MMDFSQATVLMPSNEPVHIYEQGTEEEVALVAELQRQRTHPVEIPLIIGGREGRTGPLTEIRSPHDHGHVLGRFHAAATEDVQAAIGASALASKAWSRLPQEGRSAVFLKAAELLTTRYRAKVVAATMLGQSKNLRQAELDICELADFWRFNPHFAQRLQAEHPLSPATNATNRALWRPLEGFVLAVTPFNFTAIGGNLPTAPALVGNVVLWEPASTAVLAAWYVMEILREAGLPDGVINFLPGPGAQVGDPALDHPDFAGLHFTGSTQTFNGMWQRIGKNVGQNLYGSYPRIVGETGGKDFILAAPDADVEALTVALFAGAFEFQGQKCSAASRAYIPESLWPTVKKGLELLIEKADVGDPTKSETFMGALIDKKAFERNVWYIEEARNSDDAEVVIGGEYSGLRGWFVSPTVVTTTNPTHRLMVDEIFGPVLTVYIYEDDHLEEIAKLVDKSSDYALTGAVFAKDRHTIRALTERLSNAAGNFYVNDKPTGAVVGQQPFGGGRGSGTNDKAGSFLNLTRWMSMQVVKENYDPPQDYDF